MKTKFGDVLIRGDVSGRYEVVDALTRQRLSGSEYQTLDAALVVARLRGGRIWQQTVDHRGRPLSDPMPLQRGGRSAPPAVLGRCGRFANSWTVAS